MKTDSGTLVHAALKQITPSKTNPRKSFNGADWPGFVENIRLHGVIVPGIGRYLESGPKGRIELVAGERRYRAAKEAGLKTMPLMIHGLTELEAVEIQQIENLQRQDLPALEEAEGFEQWCATLQKCAAVKTKDEAVLHICAKLNCSKSHVYGRLRLLRLLPAVRAAVVDGQLDVTCASLISSVPASLQPAVLKRVLANCGSRGGPMSYRDVKDMIAEDYSVSLAKALFDLKDKTLCHGNVLACEACPKRSGNLPGNEGPANVCTDPACYQAKVKSNADRALKAAETAGRRVLAPAEYDQHQYDGSYREADTTCFDDPKRRRFSVLAKKAGVKPIVTQNDAGRTIEVLDRQDVALVLKANGIRRGSSSGRTEKDKQREKLNKRYKAAAMAATPVILKGIQNSRNRPLVSPLLARAVNDIISADDQDFVMKRRGLSKRFSDSSAAADKLLKTIAKNADECALYLIELLICARYDNNYNWEKPRWSAEFLALAKLAGVKPDTYLKQALALETKSRKPKNK
jgi:ParB/RepB/Spo0J family partition protein